MMTLLEKVIRFTAIFALAFEMPVPIYWLVLHVPVSFWRKRRRAAFPAAVLLAWGSGDSILFRFHRELFGSDFRAWTAVLGLVLIAFDIVVFSSSEAELGARRIVGQSELQGSRELIAHGLYARMRHPRYLGMMTGVFGACLIVGTPALWAVCIGWLVLALITIRAEERELHARLGPAYATYSEQVPALLPFRLTSRQTQTAPRRDRP